MLGERGARIDSKTLWRGERGARLDVENPAPGRRPGQIHFQADGEKYLYDLETNSFRDAPRSVQELLEDPRFQDAIHRALRYLGEA
jgi:filamentous hemagglutinin